MNHRTTESFSFLEAQFLLYAGVSFSHTLYSTCHSVRTVFILQGYLHFSILRSHKALYEILHSASGLCGFFEHPTEWNIERQVPEGNALNLVGKPEEMSQTDKDMDWR